MLTPQQLATYRRDGVVLVENVADEAHARDACAVRCRT